MPALQNAGQVNPSMQLLSKPFTRLALAQKLRAVLEASATLP